MKIPPTPDSDAAFRAVAACTPDPDFVRSLGPSPGDETGWIFADGTFEAFELARLRREAERLRLRIGYPGSIRPPTPSARFRYRGAANEPVSFQASGTVEFLTGIATPDGGRCDGTGTLCVRVAVPDPTALIPGIHPTPHPSSESGFRTGSADESRWEAADEGDDFAPAVPGTSPTGSHLSAHPVPVREIRPGLYDAGRELLGDISFESPDAPVFTAGESVAEAEESTADDTEQAFDLVDDGPGRWKTPIPLAFRYIRADLPPRVTARLAPVAYRHAFAADDELTRIWASAAYTVRLCRITFLVDGIKRDRLPWGGDLAVSLLSNAAVFGDAEPVRLTLTLLGRDIIVRGHANGILDYSLWVAICHELLLDHYEGQEPFVRRRLPTIARILDWFAERAGADGGLIRPKDDEWCFIDWVQGEKSTALNLLGYRAFSAGIRIAERFGDTAAADRWRTARNALGDELLQRSYDSTGGLFRGNVSDATSAPSRHACFLAVLSGLCADRGLPEKPIADALADSALPAVGTPYMAALEILALHRLGHTDEALARLRRIWGGMLRLGATTFFEGYADDFDERTCLAFYGRRFGASLCHAWSSAPAFLLPILSKSI